VTAKLGPPVAHEPRPRVTVVGVGGAGGNAIDTMVAAGLDGVELVACNTDAQALAKCRAGYHVQLGPTVTRGLGAGARPEVGRAAAEESLGEVLGHLAGSDMVFVAAGLGGGTGTGAAPVIARAARERGVLTVGVVTKPFRFEGAYRMRLAEAGLAELRDGVDALIVVPNQNLFRLADARTTFADAFRMADRVLHAGVRGVTDLMLVPGLVNLDFADVRTVMAEVGGAVLGLGEGEGGRRAVDAAEAALGDPLLDDVSLRGARGVLVNVTGGPDMTLFEVDAAATRVREEVGPEAAIVFGAVLDPALAGRLRVSVVATGIAAPAGDVGAGTEAGPRRGPTPAFRFQGRP
jgi:cell division protein FtsZ